MECIEISLLFFVAGLHALAIAFLIIDGMIFFIGIFIYAVVSIVVTEFMSVIGVSGLRCVDYSGRYNYALFEMMLRSKDVEELINAAFESRSSFRKTG